MVKVGERTIPFAPRTKVSVYRGTGILFIWNVCQSKGEDPNFDKLR